MDIKQIHKLLTGGYLVLPVFILLAFLSRVFAGITFHDYISWIVLAIQIGIAFLLLQINHEFRVIEKRTFLPATFFLLFTASNPALYENLQSNISALAIVLCLIPVLKNYHNNQSQASSFNIALILTSVSIFCWQPLLFFIPLFWIGFQWFRCFNVRVFFASILGILTVYLFLSAWCLYNNDWTMFYNQLSQIGEVFSIQLIELHWLDWVVGAFIVILLIISAIDIFMTGFSEKVRTTLFFKFLYLLIIVSFILACFLNSVINDIQVTTSALISFITGYYFTMSDNNKWATYLLLFTILFFVWYYVFQIF